MNIYKNARSAAGMTQEKWAEALGLAVDSVRRYENGERIPDDLTVTMMAELSAIPSLGVWHLRNKSEIAAAVLPELARMTLPQATVNLLLAVKNIAPDIDLLLEIAKDGEVSGEESADFREIVNDCNELISAAMAVRFAERER